MTSMWEGHGAGGVPAVDATVIGPTRAQRRFVTRPYTNTPGRDRAALWTFAGLCALAVPYLLFMGRFAWFAFDEWDALAGTDTGQVGDYFNDHAGHWITLPVVAFKLMYAVVGLHSYRPYQLMAISTHIAVAVLLRQIMRRHHVDGWVATVAAAGFLCFGAGENNVFWAFQITFSGGVAFGLVHLLLADHDGPLDRRDLLGVFAGIAALMCSGTGIAMLGVVSLAVLIRRGLWPAVVHTVPAVAVYSTWYLIVRPRSVQVGSTQAFGTMRAWVFRFATEVFGHLGHFTVVGVLLAAIFVVGSVLAYSGQSLAELRRSAAAPLAMVIGAVGFIVSVSIERSIFGVGAAASGRYLWVGAALVTPALGVAADAIARRGQLFHIGVIVVLALAIPWNARQFEEPGGLFSRAYFTQQQAITLGAPRSPYARDVPPNVRPDPLNLLGDGLDIGWLLQAENDGKLPDIGPLSPELQDMLHLRLGVSQSREITPAGTCAAYDAPIDVRPVRSQQFGIDTPVVISLVEGNDIVASVGYQPSNGRVLTSELDDLHLRVESPNPGKPFVWCS